MAMMMRIEGCHDLAMMAAAGELADRMRVIVRKAVGVDVDARPGPPFYILGPMDLDTLADRLATLLVVEAARGDDSPAWAAVVESFGEVG